MEKPVVFILGVSSDIGKYLAVKYSDNGYRVVGTFRNVDAFYSSSRWSKEFDLFKCDISSALDIQNFLKHFEKLRVNWDIFISCVGDLWPYGNFFETDFDSWENSVEINSIGQLRVLHALYPMRNRKANSSVVFFAGGGVNSAPVNLSAYTAAKIMLIKMCELLDAENPDLNIFIVGPGYIKTKIHNSIGENFAEGKKESKIEDIFTGINWLIAEGKNIVGGRNFSIADDWLNNDITGKTMIEDLAADKNMYKLRRHRNDE